jgi:hypothetical protein
MVRFGVAGPVRYVKARSGVVGFGLAGEVS